MSRLLPLFLLATGSAIVCEGYADYKRLHNIHCISWTDDVATRRRERWLRTSIGGEILCRYADEANTTRPGFLNENDCDGHEDFEVATTHENCSVWWHRQAHNALPLPLMTTFALERKNDHTGVCVIGDDKGGKPLRTGRLIGATERYAACEYAIDREGETTVFEERSGDYLLLGSFDRTNPYSSDVASAFEARGEREEEALRQFYVNELERLVNAHLADHDRDILRSATGTSAETLIEALKVAPVRLLHNFFSEDRFVFHAELNRMGMHVLRSMLAEKAIDAMRRARGFHHHPDYATFMRDGFLMKGRPSMLSRDLTTLPCVALTTNKTRCAQTDFSKMTNEDLVEILMMASGYSRDMIPDIAWELRPVYHQDASHDLNQGRPSEL